MLAAATASAAAAAQPAPAAAPTGHKCSGWGPHLREEVVLDLELQAPLQPVIPPITVDIPRRLHLMHHPLLLLFLLLCKGVRREVADRQLHVQDPRCDVGDHQKTEPLLNPTKHDKVICDFLA